MFSLILVKNEKFEDNQKKDMRYNGQQHKNKRTNNILQSTTQKTKDPATRITLKTGDELRCYKNLTVFQN